MMMKMSLNSMDEVTWQQALYEERAAGLLLYGRALGLSHSESEDVLHEVFAQLLQLPATPAQPVHYCLRSFRNRALNCKRGLWRRLTRELQSKGWFEPSDAASEFETQAMHCLADLPPPQREVIVLKIWNQHIFEEIGDLLDISVNTAAGRYRYGMEKLRHCLKGSSVGVQTYERTTADRENPGFMDPAQAVAKG
ncbi:MAG: sigma-70 family RNA polymerase sigma factor [Verrucomicrobia bacterium]|nr:sigma-70 family RNA polymerase sigma factor [Verrucomicrobiota bacterium]